MAKDTQKLVKGAAIIGVAGVIVKLMGAFFRIPLTNWMGDEGMSYYGFAYNIYAALLVLATAGFPVAISRLVSESVARNEYRNAHRIFRISLMMMMVLGFVFFGICFFGADSVATKLGNPKAAPALRAISPALLLIPTQSAIRGYFQGRQNMKPTAACEIVEQFVRVVTGLTLSYMFLKVSLPKAAAGAAFGATAGSMGSLAVISIIYWCSHKSINKKIEKGNSMLEDRKTVVKKIIFIAVPIIIGAELVPIMNLIDNGIIMRRLQAKGWSYEEANAMYGLISGFCVSLISIPQMFTQAVAVSLVPAVSRSAAYGDHEAVESNIQTGFRLTMVMAYPCALGIFCLAEPILHLLYPMQKEAATSAAPTLMIFAITAITLAISQISTGVLQAIGKQTLPVWHLMIGIVAKVGVTYVLVGIHSINIKGAAIGTLVAETIAFLLNNRSIRKITGVKANPVITYVKPGMAALVMGICAYLVHRLINGFAGNAIATLIAVIIGAIIYIYLIFKFKAITIEEVERLPKGEKVARLLRKFEK